MKRAERRVKVQKWFSSDYIHRYDSQREKVSGQKTNILNHLMLPDVWSYIVV